jgi:Domain of unknown function (DUF4157)
MKAERQQYHQNTRDFKSGFESQRQGETLNAETRAALEPKFGHSFGDVRVFADSQADQLAREYQARAFTVGQDMYFRDGEYDPNSPAGMSLLTHELTHTIQQRGATMPDTLEVSRKDDSSEREARTASSQVMGGQMAQVSAVSNASVAREENEDRQASFPDPNHSVIPTTTETAPQSNPKAPTSFPGDVPPEPDPMSDVPEHDPVGWLAKQGLGKVLGKLFGIPGGIIMGTLGMESDESPAQREARKREESEQVN